MRQMTPEDMGLDKVSITRQMTPEDIGLKLETLIRFLQFYSDEKVMEGVRKLYGDERVLKELARKMGEERSRQIIEQLFPPKSDNNDD